MAFEKSCSLPDTWWQKWSVFSTSLCFSYPITLVPCHIRPQNYISYQIIFKCQLTGISISWLSTSCSSCAYTVLMHFYLFSNHMLHNEANYILPLSKQWKTDEELRLKFPDWISSQHNLDFLFDLIKKSCFKSNEFEDERINYSSVVLMKSFIWL